MLGQKLRDYSRSFYSLLSNRRKTERLEFVCPVTVSSKNQYGQISTQMGGCLNISQGGLAIECEEPLAPNTELFVHAETSNLRRFATVRQCDGEAPRYILHCAFRPAPDYWD
jgi:hypothetical protein